MSEHSDLEETHAEIALKWKIKEFFSLPNMTGYTLKSPTFLFSDKKWYLRIYPNGDTDDNSAGFVSLYLFRGNSSSEESVSFTLGIQQNDGSVYKSRDFKYEFNNKVEGYGGRNFAKLSEMRDAKNVVSSDNSLTVFCSIRVCTERLLVDASHMEMSSETSPSADQDPSRTSIEILQANFNDLFLRGRYADVTINVQDQVFKVHKSILATRSPVFACMFDHDTEEKKTGIVTITDFNPVFFKDFLSFLYTGKLDIISPINAVDMYKAADKYDIKDLKSECVRCMEKELSSEIFCDVINLAAVYNESELLKRATEFFSENIKTILRTAKWQSLLEERSTLANELLIKMVDKK